MSNTEVPEPGAPATEGRRATTAKRIATRTGAMLRQLRRHWFNKQPERGGDLLSIHFPVNPMVTIGTADRAAVDPPATPGLAEPVRQA